MCWSSDFQINGYPTLFAEGSCCEAISFNVQEEYDEDLDEDDDEDEDEDDAERESDEDDDDDDEEEEEEEDEDEEMEETGGGMEVRVVERLVHSSLSGQKMDSC